MDSKRIYEGGVSFTVSPTENRGFFCGIAWVTDHTDFFAVVVYTENFKNLRLSFINFYLRDIPAFRFFFRTLVGAAFGKSFFGLV